MTMLPSTKLASAIAGVQKAADRVAQAAQEAVTRNRPAPAAPAQPAPEQAPKVKG